jgi:PKHD-type hydroxylase
MAITFGAGKIQDRSMTGWYWFKNGFTSEEVDKIKKSCGLIPEQKATVMTAENLEEHRQSEIRWVPQNDKFDWIYQKLGEMTWEANSNMWGFDLHTMDEMIQYTIYREGAGYYNYHLDIGDQWPYSTRKVSITVQLSDESEYEGGEFEILSGTNPQTLPKGKGVVLAFPSYLLHRVTPVTKGVRESLVLWIGGNNYR